MLRFISRILLVLAALLVSLLVCERILTEDAVVKDRFVLTVARADGGEGFRSWQFSVNEFYRPRIDDSPAGVSEAVARLASAPGALRLTAVDASGRTAWTATRDAEGRFRLDGNEASLDDLNRLLTAQTVPGPEDRPTEPVTIQQVLEANLPMPTRSKVSFPEFSYRQAFPEANDDPEIVITAFHEAPMVTYLREANFAAQLSWDLEQLKAAKDPNAWAALVEKLASDLPESNSIGNPNVRADLAQTWLANWKEWKENYPDPLPPVQQRLPVNPAVVVGPDGIGQYGGAWRRCTSGFTDLYRKIGYESFTRHDPAGRIQPCLAYKWTVSPDSRVFTFYLRKGHRWSDGQPFTTQDILWVCNKQIGSAHWSDPPDWMQPTDGAVLLYEDDASDWRALARRIVQQAGAGRPSPGGQIKVLSAGRLWGNIEALADGKGDEDTPALVASDLNELFRKRGFYSPQAFAGVDLGAERRELEAAGPSRLDGDQMDCLLLMIEREDLLKRLGQRPNDPNVLEPIELNRLNLLLFRSAYRDLVGPPVKQRVKVQAVPDEAGDDSHIVRFTFRKPNSIFLEQTTTFMFYRGIFNTPYRLAVKEHPWGMRTLALSDFWNWEPLLKRLAAEGQSPQPSPGQRLWERLEEPTRQKVRSGLPPQAGGQSDEQHAAALAEYEKQIVAGLNEVMKREDFYDPAAWGALDPKARRAELIREKGFAQTMRDPAKQDEYRDLMIFEDLLRRFRQDGPVSLSAPERLMLNVMAFRAAYTDNSNRPPVARTREEGLNKAANADPRKYNTWILKMRDRENYHPQYNPHTPVLQAWRIVREKEKPEILAVRNPYYYRVDAAGNQLPYLDAIRNTISSQKPVRQLKLMSGNVDFQSREITFDEFTILKQKEQSGGYEIRLWPNDYCGEVTFDFAQAHGDPGIAALEEDPNFRHALSLALNRQEMIDIVFMGLGTPGQAAVPKGSPYYNDLQYNMSVQYDPNRARGMLDALGLDQRASDGTRLLPDGRPLILDLNLTEQNPMEAARLAVKYWQDIGLNVQIRQRAGNMMSRMVELGIFDIGMDKEGGNFFGPLLPGAYYPSNPAECPWWGPWVSYLRNGGRSGKPAPERVKELERMWNKLVTAPDETKKMEAWKALAERSARDLPLMGIMTSPGKVIYVKKNFKNVPKIALAGWIAHEPGNCCPECFYFDFAAEGK